MQLLASPIISASVFMEEKASGTAHRAVLPQLKRNYSKHRGKSMQSKGALEPFLNQFLRLHKLEMLWQCNTGNHKTVPWKTLFKAIKSNCATWC